MRIFSVMIRMDLHSPYTEEQDVIFNDVAALERYCDNAWIEAVPLQIHPGIYGDLKVIKYNYQEDISTYDVERFSKADAQNNRIDSLKLALPSIAGPYTTQLTPRELSYRGRQMALSAPVGGQSVRQEKGVLYSGGWESGAAVMDEILVGCKSPIIS